MTKNKTTVKVPRTKLPAPAAKAEETKAPSEKAQETKPEETKAPEEKAPEVKPEETKAPEEKDPKTKSTDPGGDKETAEILGKKARRDRAREVFKTHNESVDKVYFTSDGQCFVNPQFARMNADAIGNEEVIAVTRKEVQ